MTLGSPARGSAGVAAALGLAVLVVSLGAPRVAAAYSRYRSKSQCPYAWRSRTVGIDGYPQGLVEMTADEIGNAIRQAAVVWTARDPALASCTNLDLGVTMHAGNEAGPGAKFDGRNNVVFRGDVWCARGADGKANCQDSYDPSALALTSVFARGYGQIVDADIEVNAANFVWGDLELSPAGPGRQDLQNALAHELGHVLGFDHTCRLDPSQAAGRDQNGAAVPDCRVASAAVQATTMFASADPGDLAKRTLEPDDQQAVCDTYPLVGNDPLACPPPDEGFCAVGPVDDVTASGTGLWPRGGTLVVALTALGLASVRRRHRSRP